MSEQGWRRFLAADGVDDWVVLHGGAVAVFRVGSLVEAARVAAAVSQIEGGDYVLITLSRDRVTVRLSRGVFRLEADHVHLARCVSEAAAMHGALADRSLAQEVQVSVAAQPDTIDVEFWRAVLGYNPLAEDNAIDPLGHSSTVCMQEIPEGKALRHAMHLDVSVAREEAERRLAKALAAGGSIVEERDAPGAWILADRAGNKVCLVAWPDGAPTSWT